MSGISLQWDVVGGQVYFSLLAQVQLAEYLMVSAKYKSADEQNEQLT